MNILETDRLILSPLLKIILHPGKMILHLEIVLHPNKIITYGYKTVLHLNKS